MTYRKTTGRTGYFDGSISRRATVYRFSSYVSYDDEDDVQSRRIRSGQKSATRQLSRTTRGIHRSGMRAPMPREVASAKTA